MNWSYLVCIQCQVYFLHFYTDITFLELHRAEIQSGEHLKPWPQSDPYSNVVVLLIKDKSGADSPPLPTPLRLFKPSIICRESFQSFWPWYFWLLLASLHEKNTQTKKQFTVQEVSTPLFNTRYHKKQKEEKNYAVLNMQCGVFRQKREKQLAGA